MHYNALKWSGLWQDHFIEGHHQHHFQLKVPGPEQLSGTRCAAAGCGRSYSSTEELKEPLDGFMMSSRSFKCSFNGFQGFSMVFDGFRWFSMVFMVIDLVSKHVL